MTRQTVCVLLLAGGGLLASKTAVAQEGGAPPVTQAPRAGSPAQTDATPAPGEQERAAQEPGDAAPTTNDGTVVPVPGGSALGMSILGNQEAPTSLVIVPWKSSELGRPAGVSLMLDDSRQPVDRDVFMRALRYYEIRSDTKR